MARPDEIEELRALMPRHCVRFGVNEELVKRLEAARADVKP